MIHCMYASPIKAVPHFARTYSHCVFSAAHDVLCGRCPHTCK